MASSSDAACGQHSRARSVSRMVQVPSAPQAGHRKRSGIGTRDVGAHPVRTDASTEYDHPGASLQLVADLFGRNIMSHGGCELGGPLTGVDQEIGQRRDRLAFHRCMVTLHVHERISANGCIGVAGRPYLIAYVRNESLIKKYGLLRPAPPSRRAVTRSTVRPVQRASTPAVACQCWSIAPIVCLAVAHIKRFPAPDAAPRAVSSRLELRCVGCRARWSSAGWIDSRLGASGLRSHA